MSWFSSGLEHLGISRDFQRRVTGAIPVVGGIITPSTPIASGPAVPVSAAEQIRLQQQGNWSTVTGGSAIEQGIAAVLHAISGNPTAPVVAQSSLERWKTPILLGGGALLLGVGTILVLRKR